MQKIIVCIKRVVDYNVRVRVKPHGSGVMLDGVKMSVNPFDEIALEEALAPRAELQRMLADIKRDGYATSTRTRRLVDEVSLCVPVNSHERFLASLTVRFITSAVPLKSALERFLPKLRQCSAVINTLYSEQQPDAHATGAPETAA